MTASTIPGGRIGDHSPADCQRELYAAPDFDRFRCKPESFVCSCGQEWAHVCDEAEGCFYIKVPIARLAQDTTGRPQATASESGRTDTPTPSPSPTRAAKAFTLPRRERVVLAANEKPQHGVRQPMPPKEKA